MKQPLIKRQHDCPSFQDLWESLIRLVCPLSPPIFVALQHLPPLAEFGSVPWISLCLLHLYLILEWFMWVTLLWQRTGEQELGPCSGSKVFPGNCHTVTSAYMPLVKASHLSVQADRVGEQALSSGKLHTARTGKGGRAGNK